MNKYKFFYLIWLIPAYLLFLGIHQVAVFYSIVDTFENGVSYNAEVVDFDIKQIASQTNGYIILRFDTATGETIQQRLSLPIEMAGKLTDIRLIPIRHHDSNFQNIVMVPTYSTQKGLVLTNMAMALVGFLIALFVAIAVHRHARRKLNGPDEELIIERID
jgi:hypothetical protein